MSKGEHTRFREIAGGRFVLGDRGKSSYCPEMTMRELAGLEVHEVGHTGESAPRNLVILLHGYGAPGTDLLSLASEIDAPRDTLFLFPEAPIDLSVTAPELAGGRAWWPIDIIRLQVAMMTGAIADFAENLRPGLTAAVAQLATLVEEASREYSIGMERVVLGGFSQGAILSLETALQKQWPLAGVLLFSSSYLDALPCTERASRIANMQAVMSHGQMDPILPFAVAEQLQRDLSAAGWNVDWVPFLGGHGIPPKALAAAGRLLTRRCG